VENHEGPQSGSPDQSPPEVGDLPAEWVEEQTVERCAGILGQRGPVAVEDDKEGDANFYSIVPVGSAGPCSCLTPIRRKPCPTDLKLSSSLWKTPRTRHSLR
jgi:hypothetical protein